MRGIYVRIIGADSFGVRSMATVVEVNGLKMFIDPGVSYAPRRYGLPPHPLEEERLASVRERILREIADTDVVVITHYHYDHYLYRSEDAELYKGKILLVKHPSRDINVSQRIRAHRFLKTNRVADLAKTVHFIDSSRYSFDGVELVFSPPVPHGAEGSKLGYVVMVAVKCCDEVFVHASDVQGPMSRSALEWILSLKPSLIYISGPPTYFAGYKVSEDSVRAGLANLERLAASGATIIADHHFARDLQYPELVRGIREATGGEVLSAAEYMGVPYEPLEALRKKLWKEHPPNSG